MKILFLLLLTCFTSLTARSQALSVSFKKSMEIKDSEEFFLGQPKDLRIGSDKIFISDLMEMKIKVFSKETGAFLYAIGKRGRGPGEFLDITSFSIRNQSVYVNDFTNARLSVFNINGDLVEEHKMDISKIRWPRFIYPYTNGSFLIYYRVPQSDHFHVWDNELQKELTSFSIPEQLLDDHIFDLVTEFYPGSILAEEEKLYYAPFLYSGSIFSKKFSQEDEFIAHMGFHNGEPVYEMVSKSNDNNITRNYDLRLNTPTGRFAIKVNSLSKGLFKMDGYLIHFIEIKNDDQKELGIEVYDSSGSYLGYNSFFSQPIDKNSHSLITEYFHAADEKNNVYTILYDGKEFSINKYALTLRIR